MKVVFSILFICCCALANAQGWDAYSAKIDTHEAIISCDLALRLKPADPSKPNVLVVEFMARETDDRGFPVRKDWELLNRIEDTIAQVMAEENGLFVGRASYNGKKQLFFYLGDTTAALAMLDLMLNDFQQFKPGRKIVNDPQWDYYHNFLFPQPREFNGIINQRQLAGLQEEGDRLVSPRFISHWAYFETKTDREMYKGRMESVKFRIDKEVRSPGDGKFPFALQFSRKDLPSLNFINDLTWQLYRLAEKYGGNYEGWECEAVTE